MILVEDGSDRRLALALTHVRLVQLLTGSQALQLVVQWEVEHTAGVALPPKEEANQECWLGLSLCSPLEYNQEVLNIP